MICTATAADVMVAMDAWSVSVARQRAAEAAMHADMTQATVAAVAVAREAQQRAWAVWDRAERSAT